MLRPLLSRFRQRVPGVLALLWLLAAAPVVIADTVILRNGDRLTGTIRHMDASSLRLATSWGGTIEIDRAEVASFAADRLLVWSSRFGGEPGRAGFGLAESPGVVMIDEGEGPKPVPMSRVALLEPRPEETENGVARKGRISLSTGWSEGNSDSQRIWGEADFRARARDWRYDLGFKLRRETDDGQTTADQWLATGSHDRFIAETRFWYLRGSLERDRFKDLSTRAAAGVGHGWQLVDSERTQLALRTGVDLVAERRIVEDDEHYLAAGWGIDFRHRLSLASAELFHDQTGYWNLKESGKMTIRSRTGVRVPVRDGLTASLQVNLDWEREPSPGRRASDTSWLLGLGYEW